MPYIKIEDRYRLQQLNFAIETAELKTAGELNYAMYKLAQRFLELHGLSYQTCADIDSAYSCGGKEFYRRVTGPYEDVKIHENQDVDTMKNTLLDYEIRNKKKWCHGD